jgi:hypothetical protein
MKKYTIEFATTCYEKDWELMLKTNRLRNMIKACKHSFDKVTLYINNVDNYEKVSAVAEQYKKEGVIDEYVRVSDYTDTVKQYFNIRNEQGFYYLAQFLTMIYRSKCDYLLNFTGDAMINSEEEWIDSSIKKMEENERIIVANPLMTGDYKMAMRESFDEDEQFYISYGFSDQCFLVRPEFFRADIYNEENGSSLFYPEKTRGVAFEERVYKFMRNHKYFRITHKKASYRHKNFPKNSFKKVLALYFGINNKKYGIV